MRSFAKIYDDQFTFSIEEVAYENRDKVIAKHAGANSIKAAIAAFEAVKAEYGSMTILQLREKSRILRVENGTWKAASGDGNAN